MNKQSILDNLDSPKSSDLIVENFKSDIKRASRDQLQLILKKLNFLCLEFDPYSAHHLKVEEENILNEFNLIETIKNPFVFTNTILQMLDNVETELNTRLQ